MISVGIRKPKHPQWVEEFVSAITDEEKDFIVKATIYMNMDKEGDGYRVSKTLRSQANRTDSIFEKDHAIWILLTACCFFTYFTAEQNKDKIEFE